MTCVASAIWGTHLGDTKLAASMAGKPASVSRSMSPTLISVGTTVFSFCNPSRGPTSTMDTCRGNGIAAVESIAMYAVDHARNGKARLQTPDIGRDLGNGSAD